MIFDLHESTGRGNVDTRQFPSYLCQDTSPRPGKIRVDDGLRDIQLMT